MQVDISFSVAKVYDFKEWVDIVKGEDFVIHTDAANKIHFFSNNDEVLSLKEEGKDIKGNAKEIGNSTILIMDENYTRLKTIQINVVATVDMVSSIGLSTGDPVLKTEP